MAIQYASGTRSVTLTSVDTKAQLMTAVDTALTTAGWTVTTNSGATDKIYQSVLTPQNNQIKVRVWDSGGNCLRFRMMNNAQTVAQADSCYLYPQTSTSFKIIANQYQFAVFVPGSVSSRNFVFASAMYIPPHLVAMGLSTVAFIMGDGGSDTDTTVRGSFRTSLNARGIAGSAPMQGWSIVGSTAVEYNNLSADSNSHPGLPALVCFQSTAIHAVSGYRWHDDSALIVEPLVCWGVPITDVEAKIRGQIWDAFIATESYPADVTATIDSHTFYNITDNNVGNATLPGSMRGSLFLVSA